MAPAATAFSEPPLRGQRGTAPPGHHRLRPLTALVLVTAVAPVQLVMIASATLASVVFGLLDEASEVEPVAAPLTAFATLVVVAALTLRGSEGLRLWGPVIGIVVGCVVAAVLGIYDIDPVLRAALGRTAQSYSEGESTTPMNPVATQTTKIRRVD